MRFLVDLFVLFVANKRHMGDIQRELKQLYCEHFMHYLVLPLVLKFGCGAR
jgi:hypothetical protein